MVGAGPAIDVAVAEGDGALVGAGASSPPQAKAITSRALMTSTSNKRTLVLISNLLYLLVGRLRLGVYI
jgi:hypothetical protein